MNELNKLFQNKENYINSKLKTLDKEARKLQSNLLETIISDYAGKFDVKDGKLLVNTKNMRLAAELERLMDKFNVQYGDSVLIKTANDMLKITEFTKKYYEGMDYSAKLLNSIEENMGYVSERIGITPKNKIISGSYLDSLSQAPEVRRQLKDYVLKSISEGKRYNQFLGGFRELVAGSKDVEGAMVKYYQQYVYDTFSVVDRAIDKHYSNELNLEYFIYAGGLIKTSREFCRKRAGKVFTKKEAEKWRDDPTLVFKNKEAYNPLIDMGGYRCRHKPMYISEELAKEKKYENTKK